MRRPLISLCAALLLLVPGLPEAQTSARFGTVRWDGERLTVQVVNAPLKDLVEEVSRRTGMAVTGADRLAGHRTLDFTGATLHEALRVLLDRVNYLATMEGGVTHVRIHSMTSDVKPPGTGPIHVPGLTDRAPGQSDVVDDLVDVEDLDEDEAEELELLEDTIGAPAAIAVDDLTDALESEYVAVRLRALQLLSFRSADAAIPALVEALGDDDLDVALTASDVMAAMSGPAPLEALLEQLAEDVDADVQFAALRALALRADLTSLPRLRLAVPNTDPLVREQAAMLLKELERRAKAAAAFKP
ncbi:MAG TPA: HEAT repeat domain-containing protein [Vicinamibacterales bacterium]|nr:HEAT repeat domain-containing protein [Vicinamibacterales bacterium]